MKKYLFLFVALLFSVVLLSACGSDTRELSSEELARMNGGATPTPTATAPSGNSTGNPTPTPTTKHISFAIVSVNDTLEPNIPIQGVSVTVNGAKNAFSFNETQMTDPNGRYTFDINNVPNDTEFSIIFPPRGSVLTGTVEVRVNPDGTFTLLNPSANVTQAEVDGALIFKSVMLDGTLKQGTVIVIPSIIN